MNIQQQAIPYDMDAATGNERRPTVGRRNGETCRCVDQERSRRRPDHGLLNYSYIGAIIQDSMAWAGQRNEPDMAKRGHTVVSKLCSL